MSNRINMTNFNDGGNPYRELLETFLLMPLGGADEIFDLFSSLPGAIKREGKKPMERFVYIPGTREDRILLTAHADTAWDERYGVEPIEPIEPKFALGMYFSASTKHGIAADDRVGCALLWGLRDCGHSILLTDGMERGKIGARYLRKHHKKLYREINRTHRMILALDGPGGGSYLLKQDGYTKEFCEYIEEHLTIKYGLMRGESDLDILGGSICGASLGVGYVCHHRNTEMFFVKDWNRLYRTLYAFLREEHPRFPISKSARFKHRLVKRFPLPARVYGKLKTDGFKATAAAVWRRIKRWSTRR